MSDTRQQRSTSAGTRVVTFTHEEVPIVAGILARAFDEDAFVNWFVLRDEVVLSGGPRIWTMLRSPRDL